MLRQPSAWARRINSARIIRRWNSQPYRPGLFETGWMPAHPTFYVKRSVYERFGGFDLRFGCRQISILRYA